MLQLISRIVAFLVYHKMVEQKRYPKTGTSQLSYKEIAVMIQQEQEVILTEEDVITFFRGMETPGFMQVLAKGAVTGVFSLDESLVEVLAIAGSMVSVYTVAMLLRMGSNPNNYYAEIHPLGVLYNNWNTTSGNSRLNMLTILMIYYGCNPMLPVRDGETSSKQTVLDWINLKGYDNIISKLYPGYASIISETTAIDLAILIGSNENIGTSQLDEVYIKKVIIAGSNSLLSLGTEPKEMEGMDYGVIYWSIEYFNTEAFKYYTSKGYKMSYPMTNTVILRIGQYTKNKESLFLTAYLDILGTAVSSGQLLDSHQQSLLMSASSEGYQSIMSMYQVPYWKKVCSYKSSKNTKSPGRLSALSSAIDLDMNGDHDMTCRSIENISTIDPEELLEAASLRQKHRMSSRHATIEEYLGGTPPLLNYFNVSPADGDLNSYIDICTVSYRDSGGRIWVFLSRDYNLILSKNRNPVNGDEIPIYMIDEIKSKITRMKAAGLSPDKPITHRDVLDQLTKIDTANNQQSDKEKSNLVIVMSEEGVTAAQLESLSAEDLNTATVKGGYNSTIKLLDQQHALVTAAYIINYFIINKPSKGKTMIQALKSLLYTQSL